MRPHIQVISHSTLQRNVSHAGGDLVLSYATMEGNIIFNILERNDIIVVAEGLNVFTAQSPLGLADKTLIESNIRQQTGCNILSIRKDGQQVINPDPEFEISDQCELVMVGTTDDEKQFMEVFRGK